MVGPKPDLADYFQATVGELAMFPWIVALKLICLWFCDVLLFNEGEVDAFLEVAICRKLVVFLLCRQT